MPYNYENPFSSDDELASLYEKKRQESENDSVLWGSIKSGATNLGSTGNAALAALSRTVGLDSLAANRERASQRWAAEAAGEGSRSPHFGTIHNLSDVGDWATGAIGSNIPLLATMALGGAAGGVLGSAARGH